MKLSELDGVEDPNGRELGLESYLVSGAEGYHYFCSVNISGVIAAGWYSDDNILVITSDGDYIYDVETESLQFYEPKRKNNFSADNLSYFSERRNEDVKIFGLRGGDGNHFYQRDYLSIEMVSLSSYITIPVIRDLRTSTNYFLELKQNTYEGKKYIGFSNSYDMFLISGSQGVDIYKRHGAISTQKHEK